MALILKDDMTNKDRVSFSLQNKPYARTKIIGGYDAYTDKNGITQFGEKVFETENMIVLGGSLFTLEKVFGVQSSLYIETLNNIAGIATEQTTPINDNKNTFVCLFGVGTGGAGESITDVKDVKYYEREIFDMIPIRQTSDELLSDEAEKYWFKKSVNIGGVNKLAYYLKAFETAPKINVLWRDGEGDDDGSEVNGDVYATPDSNTTPIDTFIEMTLKINKKDVREYFEDLGNTEVSRINSIGLFTGVKTRVIVPTLDGGTTEGYDYTQVKLFSKLNINNEVLTLAKDLTIAYRIYTS